MNIVTALNKKYVPYTIVMLTSLCINNRDSIDVYLLHSELEHSDFEKIEQALGAYRISIHPLKVDSSRFDAKIKTTTMWTVETYFRLFLPELLPTSVDRILYLDVDMIINGSLDELYTVELGEDEIISAQDNNGADCFALFTEKQKEMFAPLYSQGGAYFNAGIMLMNMKKIRGKYGFSDYVRVMEEWNYEMGAPDQDVLNYAHHRFVGYIDWKEYDLFANGAHVMGMSYEQVKRSARVIHFAGSKPWNTTSYHFDIEKLWWDYAKQTPIYAELLEAFVNQAIEDDEIEEMLIEGMKYYNEAQMWKEKGEQLLQLNQKLISLTQNETTSNCVKS